MPKKSILLIDSRIADSQSLAKGFCTNNAPCMQGGQSDWLPKMATCPQGRIELDTNLLISHRGPRTPFLNPLEPDKKKIVLCRGHLTHISTGLTIVGNWLLGGRDTTPGYSTKQVINSMSRTNCMEPAASNATTGAVQHRDYGTQGPGICRNISINSLSGHITRFLAVNAAPASVASDGGVVAAFFESMNLNCKIALQTKCKVLVTNCTLSSASGRNFVLAYLIKTGKSGKQCRLLPSNRRRYVHEIPRITAYQ